jgi:non-specific serine/threonine protein kinase
MEQLVAATFGVQSREGMSIGGAVREFLRTKTLLIVFDNCEHLLEPAGRLADAVLRACPQGANLGNESRAPRRRRRTRSVLRWTCPKCRPTPSVARRRRAPVHRSLARSTLARARLRPPRRSVSQPPPRRHSARPRTRAARCGDESPAEIVAHLDERFRLLRGGRRSGIDRHQTLRDR